MLGLTGSDLRRPPRPAGRRRRTSASRLTGSDLRRPPRLEAPMPVVTPFESHRIRPSKTTATGTVSSVPHLEDVSPDQTFEDHRDVLDGPERLPLLVSPDQTFEDHRDPAQLRIAQVRPLVSPDQTFEDHRDLAWQRRCRRSLGLTGSDLRRPPRPVSGYQVTMTAAVSPDQTFEDHRDAAVEALYAQPTSLTGSDLRRPPRRAGGP